MMRDIVLSNIVFMRFNCSYGLYSLQHSLVISILIGLVSALKCTQNLHIYCKSPCYLQCIWLTKLMHIVQITYYLSEVCVLPGVCSEQIT